MEFMPITACLLENMKKRVSNCFVLVPWRTEHWATSPRRCGQDKWGKLKRQASHVTLLTSMIRIQKHKNSCLDETLVQPRRYNLEQNIYHGSCQTQIHDGQISIARFQSYASCRFHPHINRCGFHDCNCSHSYRSTEFTTLVCTDLYYLETEIQQLLQYLVILNI